MKENLQFSMMEPRAEVVLIDNSLMTIDSDFKPNRLEAQKVTVDRFVSSLLSMCPANKFSIGTLGGDEFGIRLSLTSDYNRISDSFANISHSGAAHLEKGIKRAILALKRCGPSIHERRILAFVASPHDIDSKTAKSIVESLVLQSIAIDIVVVGSGFANIDVLQEMCNEVPTSLFLSVPQTDTHLSDAVLLSAIRPGTSISSIDPAFWARTNPEFATALYLSKHGALPHSRPAIVKIFANKAFHSDGGRPKVRHLESKPSSEFRNQKIGRLSDN